MRLSRYPAAALLDWLRGPDQLPLAADQPAPAPPPVRSRLAQAWHRLTTWHTILAVVGIVVLVWWGSWWTRGLAQNKLKKSPQTWFVRFEFLGLDFLHNYQAARHWTDGGDPYREPFGDPLGRKLCYPPVVLPFFAWCKAFAPHTAVVVWTAALAVMAGAGTVAAWKTRQALNLWPVPLPFALAGVLTCAPVAYAMERGNYDLLVVPLILVASWALQARSTGRDALAGSCLALATCFKVYPALLILGLLPLRRGRAFLFAGAAGLGMASFQAHNLPICVENLRALARTNNPDVGASVSPSGHSLGGQWRLLWKDTKLEALSQVPPSVGTLGLLGPALLALGYRLYRLPDPRKVIYPFFLWTAAVATFIPQVANDYSLFFLPMAALAVWDRRDRVPVHLLLAFMLVWAQPVLFTVGPRVLFTFKLLTVYGVALSLLARIREQADASRGPVTP